MAHYPALDYNTKLDYDDGWVEFVVLMPMIG